MTCPRCTVLEARLAEEIRRRTLGGVPPESDKEWGNRKLAPAEHVNGR